MRFTASAFLGLALLLFGDVSWGQTPAQAAATVAAAAIAATEKAEREKAWPYFFFEEVLQRSCDDPTLRSAIALPQPKMILQITEDGKTKIKTRVGVQVKKKVVFNLEVVSPRKESEESEEITLANLDGLSNGSTADLALSWFIWDPPKYIKVGEDALEKALKANPETTDTKLRIRDYAKGAILRPSAIAALGSERYKEIVQEYRNWMKKENPMIPVLTLKGHAEPEEFDFFLPSAGPPAGLKETSESHTNYQITGSAGFYLWGGVYSSLNYSRGREYKKGDTKDFCIPSTLTGVLRCETLVIAPPSQKRAEILEFEARGLVGSFGLGAHITRDLRDNVTVIEIPVYLLQKFNVSQMELNLGARAQWRSDTRDLAVSVFIGPALSTVFRMF